MNIYELIGDIELFRPVLDGFFKDWEGTCDILLESGEYIFHPKKGACQFCETLRKNPEGEKLCRECDHEYANKAASKGVISYVCHAGLIDIAAPILVNSECQATVLCGQVRPEGKEDIKDALEKITNLENKLGLNLKGLWYEARPISENELDNIKIKLTNLTKYLSEKWKGEIRLERAEKNLALQVKENAAIRTAFTGLSSIFETDAAFWDALDKVIREICVQFEAIYGVVLDMNELNGIPTLQIKVNLPEERFLKHVYPDDQILFQELLRNKEPKVIDFDYSVAGTLCYDIADWLTSDNCNGYPDEMALWPLYFEENYYGVLCLFIKKEEGGLKSLPIKDEGFILEPFLGQILSAYKNCKLFQRERGYRDLQSVWLQDVVHEVEQPINGSLGYAELWNDYLISILEGWPDSKESLTYDIVTSLHNGLESILWMTLNASQVARNFAWLAYETKEIDLSIDNDLSGTLIACARDKQGQAKAKGVTGPNVVLETIKPFDGRVQINKNLFKQAIRNLIDNAVKYASNGTTVTVDAIQQDSYLIIKITDFGIPILPGEEESIFIRRKRSELAENSNIGGAGIGLTIARDIMVKHKGNIRTYPSQLVHIKGREHHKTVFEAMLPLLNTKDEKND